MQSLCHTAQDCRDWLLFINSLVGSLLLSKGLQRVIIQGNLPWNTSRFFRVLETNQPSDDRIQQMTRPESLKRFLLHITWQGWTPATSLVHLYSRLRKALQQDQKLNLHKPSCFAASVLAVQQVYLLCSKISCCFAATTESLCSNCSRFAAR